MSGRNPIYVNLSTQMQNSKRMDLTDRRISSGQRTDARDVSSPLDSSGPNNTRKPHQTLLRSTVQTAAVAGTAGVAVPTVATAGLAAAGFSSGGIVAGSAAAVWQASIGNVVAGSAFAGLQSLGATGGFAILGPVGIAAAAIGGGTFAGWKYWKHQRRRVSRQSTNGMSKSDRPEDDGSSRKTAAKGAINQNASCRKEEEEKQRRKRIIEQIHNLPTGTPPLDTDHDDYDSISEESDGYETCQEN